MKKIKKDDHHEEIISAFLYEITRMRANAVNYIAKFELYEKLSQEEAIFLNEISIACQKFLDTVTIKGVKDNGKLEQ